MHSYAADTDDAIVIATCDYGGPVVAAVERDSVWATQFHPEKSSRTGLAVLSAFVDRCAAAVRRLMDLYPAIDLRGGQVVQLIQGDFDRERVHGDDPVAVAKAFVAAGRPLDPHRRPRRRPHRRAGEPRADRRHRRGRRRAGAGRRGRAQRRGGRARSPTPAWPGS